MPPEEHPHQGKYAQCRWPCLAYGVLLVSSFSGFLAAQELQPRAYIPAPVGVNFFNVGYSRDDGGISFAPSLPIADAQADANYLSLGFGQSLGVLGRSAQVLAVVPYVQADLSGTLNGIGHYRYRSGLGDSVFRYSMNIIGAPAMDLKAFSQYRQKTIVGASITVSAPTGQYDPNVLINIGENRWEFKPEIGISHARGKWVLEGAAGAWMFTKNPQYEGRSLTQVPVGSFQSHVVRLLPHRTWLAFDGNLFTGGRTQVNGIDQANYQMNSRLGVSLGIKLNARHAIKFSYFSGVETRVGAAVQSVGITYTVIWFKGH
jgi:hypothetical protein